MTTDTQNILWTVFFFFGPFKLFHLSKSDIWDISGFFGFITTNGEKEWNLNDDDSVPELLEHQLHKRPNLICKVTCTTWSSGLSYGAFERV